MRNKLSTRRTMVDLLEQARYEVLPTPSTEDKLLEHVPVDRVVTITASPTKGLDATFALAESLTTRGYTVVPHLAARMITGRTELAEICERLTGRGIRADKCVLGVNGFSDARELQVNLVVEVTWEDLRTRQILAKQSFPISPDVIRQTSQASFAPEVGQSLATANRRAIGACLVSSGQVGEAQGFQRKAVAAFDAARDTLRRARDFHSMAGVDQWLAFEGIQYAANFWEGRTLAIEAITQGRRTGNVAAEAWANWKSGCG